MSANVGFGASTVAMNSYIPSLAKEAPEVVKVLEELEVSTGDLNREGGTGRTDPNSSAESATAPLLASSSHPEDVNDSSHLDGKRVAELEKEYQAELSRATSRISSLGIALGYGAGICMLIVALIPVTMLKGTTFALRLAIGLSGVWWAVFTIPAAVWLPSTASTIDVRYRERVGRRVEDVDLDDDKDWRFGQEVAAAWIRLGNMLRWREIKKLRNTFKYLAAWFLLSDGASLL